MYIYPYMLYSILGDKLASVDSPVARVEGEPAVPKVEPGIPPIDINGQFGLKIDQ